MTLIVANGVCVDKNNVNATNIMIEQYSVKTAIEPLKSSNTIAVSDQVIKYK